MLLLTTVGNCDLDSGVRVLHFVCLHPDHLPVTPAWFINVVFQSKKHHGGRKDSHCWVTKEVENLCPCTWILYILFCDFHKLPIPCCCIVSAGCLDLQWNLCVWRFHLLLSRSDLWILNSAPLRGRRGRCRLLKWNGSTLNLLFSSCRSNSGRKRRRGRWETQSPPEAWWD